MKKFILLFISFFILFQVRSQAIENNKKRFMGAGLGIYYQKNNIPFEAYNTNTNNVVIYSTNGTSDTKYFNGSIFLSGGKQVEPYSAFGGFISYGWEKNSYEGFVLSPTTSLVLIEETVQNYGIGIFARYILNPENLLQIYLQPSFSYRRNNNTREGSGINNTEIRINTLELSAPIGFLYQLNESIRLQMSIGSFYLLFGNWNNLTGSAETFFAAGTSLQSSSIRIGAEYMF